MTIETACETLASFLRLQRSMNSRLIRGVLAGILLLACGWLVKDIALPVNDSVAYWAAARLVLSHQNPYQTDAVLALERQAGYSGKSPLVVLNPPWVLPFLMPLAFFSYPQAQKIWLVLGCICIAVSIYLLWKLYGRTRYPTPVAYLVITLFTPTLVVLTIGQIGPLVVLGITSFLWFERKQKYGLAGICVFLLALKPHLTFLFWIALVLWVVRQKKWQIFFNGLATAGIVIGLTILREHQIFSQYHDFWIHNPAHWTEFPTISGIAAHLLKSQSTVLVLIPPALACVWLLQHWFRFRESWNWQDELPILLLVSLVSSPYAWFFDGVILLPALFQVITLPSWKRGWFAPLVCYGVINLVVVLLISAGKNLFWYAWVASVWLLLYLWSLHAGTGKAGVLSPRKS